MRHRTAAAGVGLSKLRRASVLTRHTSVRGDPSDVSTFLSCCFRIRKLSDPCAACASVAADHPGGAISGERAGEYSLRFVANLARFRWSTWHC